MTPELKISICLPTFGRPQRTKRILQHIGNQTLSPFELLLIGDGCNDLKLLTRTDWWDQWRREFILQGNYMNFFNFDRNMGCFGAYAIHYAVRHARGKYFCWANNDDILKPEHLHFYFRSIDDTDADFVYNDTIVVNAEGEQLRNAELKNGSIGHSELVVRTEFLKEIFRDKDFFMRYYTSGYGHDWHLVQKMVNQGARHEKGKTGFPTYYVMGTPAYREQGID